MNMKLARYAFATALAGGAVMVTACEVSGDLETDDDSDVVSASQALSLGSSLGAPLSLPAGTPMVNGSPSTCALNDGVHPSSLCTTSSASDISFVWTAPSAGSFKFTTIGSNFDTVLHITSYASPGSVLACEDKNRSTTGETATLSLTAGAQVIVTVDGYASLCGNYKLNITKNCASACNTPGSCQTGGTCSINGTCQYSNAPLGTPCSDNLYCTTGDVCNGAGACIGSLLSGYAMCGGECTDTSLDSCNCGTCGTACDAPLVCGGGLCKSCFAAGTPITMADGSDKPIEAVVVGDWVLGYDTRRDIAVPSRVSRTFVHPNVQESLLINGTVRVTAEHPFYVNGAWVEAGKLRAGDQIHRLVSSESDPHPMVTPIDHIEKISGGLTTYNLEVENVHDYFADGYLVHNKSEICLSQQ